MGKVRLWEADEDAFMREHYGKISVNDIEKILGRSRDAVKARAVRLKRNATGQRRDRRRRGLKMITHSLKIRKEFADAILRGDKTFEVCENDRGFQRGDYVRFTATDTYATEIPYHPINEKAYKTTYVLSGWGIEPGQVVFAIKETTHDARNG